jgi:CRP-like cAMP-binding protein
LLTVLSVIAVLLSEQSIGRRRADHVSHWSISACPAGSPFGTPFSPWVTFSLDLDTTWQHAILTNFGQLLSLARTEIAHRRPPALHRDEGMHVLAQRGWLGATPVDFRTAILSLCGWQNLDAGATIQLGGEEFGELIGLASGIIENTTVLGVAGTPLMHLTHAVDWVGYGPIISPRPRPVATSARTSVWLARAPQASVVQLLAKRPEWWRHFLPLSLEYGDAAASIAADLLIRGSERRCAAILLRLGGCRFAGPDDSRPIEIPVSQDELAGAANMSRNTAGTMLRKLAARGLIEPAYRSIIARVPAKLRAFVEAA